MLAKIAPATNDFHAMARYLVRGKPGTKPHPNRVAWVATQNLPTTDPELAATYMTASAAASQRVRRAAYHLMIAWHANERPTPEIMQEVALQTMALAGLAEHEALIMGHGDKPHPHLHILLNRVLPATGKAWSTSHDYKRFDEIMRELSESYGFRFVPAHAFNRELTDELPRKPDSPATYAGMRGAKTQRLQWSSASSRRFGKEISEELGQTPTPEELGEIVAKRGLSLERKGQGFVVGNDVSYAKLSRLGIAVNGKAAGRERSPAFSKTSSAPEMMELVDGVDIVRALSGLGLADRDDLRRAIRERQEVRASRRKSLPYVARANLELRQALSSTQLKAPATTHQEAQKGTSASRSRSSR